MYYQIKSVQLEQRLIQILMCSIGGIDCVPKWKHVLTPSGICLELKLQHDPDFQALGKLTLNSNVLGLIVSTNLRTVSFSNNLYE